MFTISKMVKIPNDTNKTKKELLKELEDIDKKGKFKPLNVKERNHSQNMPKNEYSKSYLRIIAIMLFFILFIVANNKEDNKEIQLTTNINFQYNIECSARNETNGEEFKMLFLDWADLEAFQKITDSSFDTCSDLRNYPQYIQ